MVARIYLIGTSSTQSGTGSNKWMFEFAPENKFINDVMGWASSRDTSHEVKIQFDTKEAAIQFAKDNNYEFETIETKKPKLIAKSYASNFL